MPISWLACPAEAPDDEAYNLVIAVADGSVAHVDRIADRLGAWSQPIETAT